MEISLVRHLIQLTQILTDFLIPSQIVITLKHPIKSNSNRPKIDNSEFSEICNPLFSMEMELGHYKRRFLMFYASQTHWFRY